MFFLFPGSVFCGNDGKGPLECRLRYKLPSPAQLLQVDKEAFTFYFNQVRTDFCRGQVLTPGSPFTRDGGPRKSKWYIPAVMTEDQGEISR